MSTPLTGSSDMKKYVLRSKLADNPNVTFYYKGTEDECGVPLALNTIVAFDMSDALVMTKDNAYRLCEELNRDKEFLISTGYTEFEVIPFEE
jgi:hypothetical protein